MGKTIPFYSISFHEQYDTRSWLGSAWLGGECLGLGTLTEIRNACHSLHI